MARGARLRAIQLRIVQRWDRLRLARLRARHPGLVFEPGASTNLAAGRYVLEPGARVVFGAGVHADRTPGGLVVIAGRDARIEIGAGTWLRGETEPVRIVAFAGAVMIPKMTPWSSFGASSLGDIFQNKTPSNERPIQTV